MFHALRHSRLVALVLLILLAATTLPAQTSRGTVTGIVTDPSGAVVANAKVTLIQKDTNVARETVTNSAGLYRFDAVNLGNHAIKVTAAGFANAQALGIEVRANQISTQDFALAVGSESQTVEVAADAAAVQLQTDEQLRGANIGTKSLTELPISGQNSLNLMTLAAGILPSNLGGNSDNGVGSVNGSRARANNFMIDGVDNNDISVAGPAVRLYNSDAVQEVSIQTADYSAEFGRSGGAVVNQVTKSGTNHIHGTAAWDYNSDVLNAASLSQQNRWAKYMADKKAGIYDKPFSFKDPYLEQIPAFTVGGPVYIPGVYDGRNKTFWFAAGQWDHYNSGSYITNYTVPGPDGITMLQGLAAKCPNVALYLKALNGMTFYQKTGTLDISVPAAYANTTCNGDARTGMKFDYGIGQRAAPYLDLMQNQLYRVDHVISSKQNISGRFLKYDEKAPGSFGLSAPFDSNFASHHQSTAINDTYVINSTMTNELRLTYLRQNYGFPVTESTGMGALPSFTFSYLSGFGTNGNYPQGRIANTYQLQDTLTKVRGHHQFRMGGEYFKQIATQTTPLNFRGTVTYSTSGAAATGDLINGFANFIDDYSGPGNGKVAKQYGMGTYHPTYGGADFFFQDSWKARTDLTLNMGIRYENYGQPANIFPYPAMNVDPAGFSKAKIPNDTNNWAPSVGFAYNPKWGFFSDGKTVIRGGFQVGYDRWFNNLFSNMAAGTPNNPSNNPVNATSSGRGIANLYAVQFPAMYSVGALPIADASSQFAPNMVNPYTERWSFGVQHELPAGMVLDASYVGSASHKLFQQQQWNPDINPVYNPAKGLFGYTLGSRMVAGVGSRVARVSGANSNYNGLQVEVKKRVTQTPVGGIMFTSAYTWSHTLGVIDDVFATNNSTMTMMTANPILYGGNRNWDYGDSDMNRKHRLVSSVVWDIKGPKNGAMGLLLGGWTVSGVIPIQSGTPINITDGVDRDLDGSAADRPDIGNIKAPLNTMAQLVNSTTCASGWQSIATTAGVMPPCVSPTDVHWLYYPVGAYSKTTAATSRRNSLYTGGQIYADVDLIKKFKIREGFNMEARAEIFDFANSRNFNFVPANLSLSTIFNYVQWDSVTKLPKGGPTSKFMDYQAAGIDPGHRTIRLQLKAIF